MGLRLAPPFRRPRWVSRVLPTAPGAPGKVQVPTFPDATDSEIVVPTHQCDSPDGERGSGGKPHMCREVGAMNEVTARGPAAIANINFAACQRSRQTAKIKKASPTGGSKTQETEKCVVQRGKCQVCVIVHLAIVRT